jgi:myo-inositol-1(or 4)-monophosphatase
VTDRELAEAIAREAGALLLDFFADGRRREISSKSTPTDLVSEADVAAEDLIRSRLREACAEDSIVGEEGEDVTGSSGRRWVVDPLDGTVNFLFGIPQWAVSVAVEDGDGPLAGAVFDPVRGECWTAARGETATLDGEPLHPSQRSELATAMVATGFGYDTEVREVQGRLIAQLLPQVRDIRRLGSAALDLVWTAGGRYDAYFERGVKRWDVAAGALVCARAGLEVHRLEPAPPSEDGILVAPAGLAGELLAIVG